MPSLHDILKELISAPSIAGAILGSLLGFFFISLGLIYNWLMNKIPGNNVLGGFRTNDIANVFVKYLYNDNKNYWMPLALDTPESPSKIEIFNTPYVIGEADFSAIADVIIPLGKHAKLKEIKYLSPHLYLEEWNKPYLCIGTSQKTIEILKRKRCEPIFFENRIIEKQEKKTIGFVFKNENYKGFYFDNEDDETGHGIIQKTKDIETKVDVFLIMGHGKLGTRTAAHFFKENISLIGRLYGQKPFVLLIKAQKDIPNTGMIINLYPKPTVIKRIIFFRTWRKFSKNLNHAK